MLTFKNGAIKAATVLISGYLLTQVVSKVVQNNPDLSWLSILFNFGSLIAIYELYKKANYWGIMYAIGYLTIITFFGLFILEGAELKITFVILVGYILLKLVRKL